MENNPYLKDIPECYIAPLDMIAAQHRAASEYDDAMTDRCKAIYEDESTCACGLEACAICADEELLEPGRMPFEVDPEQIDKLMTQLRGTHGGD